MGRKRKFNVAREPNGRVSRAENKRILLIQRERDAIRKLALDPKWESPLGVLMLWEKITRRQFEAGLRFSEARNAADAALALPPRSARAQDISAVHGRAIEEDGPEEERRKSKLVAAYDAAESAIGLNTRMLAAVQEVVVYGMSPTSHEKYIALVEGLNRLAIHYRIPTGY